MKMRSMKRVMALLLAALLVCGAAVWGYKISVDKHILPNTYVDGIYVGDMTTEEADQALRDAGFDSLEGESLTVTLPAGAGFYVDYLRSGTVLSREQAISLDYQSTGFKWFFNLFFNLLNSTDLNHGDIIIMDEPATNLHVKGQRELRGFLKEFAIHNDISIVIATHSPFLIDLDYLDEIRVVVNKENITSIENNFAAVNENDPDSLLPIKDSLTVENHILVNPEEKVVFVEGITDYNYLTAFKILFKKEGITFLPINGVGKTKEECIKITQRLMKIRKKDPILLVDNDKAGNCIKEVNKDNKDFRIISLSEADEKFKTIESLFSDEDKGKFGLVDESGKSVKHASTSTIFKNHILKNQDEVSAETKENFAKLFEMLFEELE